METAFHHDNETWDDIIKNRDIIEFKSKTFQEYKNEWLKNVKQAELKSSIFSWTGANVDERFVIKFLQNSGSYSALRTLIYSNLYLNYIAKKSGNRPGKDKTDDFRHLIDSSYCTTFISDDKKLAKYAKEINPDIEFVTFEEFMTWFR